MSVTSGIMLADTVNKIVQQLVMPDMQRLTGWLDKIIEKNQDALNTAAPVFIHDGQFFRRSDFKGRFPGRCPPLHSSLYDEMAKFIADRKIVESDATFIRQALVLLLDKCQNSQDIRDAIPLCLEPVLTNFTAVLPRTREPLWCLEEGSRERANVEKMMPQLQLYAATRFL